MSHRMVSILQSALTLGFLPAPGRFACFAALGVLAGLGLAVGKSARVTSYLSDDPESCVNCHVMRPQYASWQRSSHAGVATCNDCHVPHETPFHAYAFKARDGIYHSTIFTLGLEPQVMHMSKAAIPVVEGNCRRCHDRAVDEVCLRRHQPGDLRCWDCHRDVPHGRMRSLASVPEVMSPGLPSVLKMQKPLIGGRRPRATADERQPGAEKENQ